MATVRKYCTKTFSIGLRWADVCWCSSLVVLHVKKYYIHEEMEGFGGLKPLNTLVLSCSNVIACAILTWTAKTQTFGKDFLGKPCTVLLVFIIYWRNSTVLQENRICKR
jgi:hypothetical protein